MADIDEAARMGALAALMGGFGRVAMALHSGERGVVVLGVELALGALLGIIAAALCVWFDPSLRATGWPLLMVAGAAGSAGVLGTRTMDLITDWLKRKLGD